MNKSISKTNKITHTGFWFYTILLAITILNDKILFLNMFFSLIYVSVCFYYAIKSLIISRTTLYIFLFSIFYIIYAVLSPDIPDSLNSKWGMLNWELKVMLSFFPAFYFSRNGKIRIEMLRKAGILLLAVAIISYFINISMLLYNSLTGDDGITNNVGYLFVSILPLLFLNIRKNLLLIIISYLFILLSLKRGAILCGIITIPLFIRLLTKHFHINKSIIALLVVLVSIIGIYFIQQAIKENGYIAKRVEQTKEGDSSGRDQITVNTWNAVGNFGISSIIFGRGINYSMKINGNYAHNDWLEILTSMGLFGCFLYFLTFYGMYSCCKRYCTYDQKKIGYIIITIALLRSLVSMNFFSLTSIPLYYTMGLICLKKRRLCVKS